MASVNKKLAMIGVSTILIPLVKSILKKILKKVTGKLDSQSSDEENDTLVPTKHNVMSLH